MAAPAARGPPDHRKGVVIIAELSKRMTVRDRAGRKNVWIKRLVALCRWIFLIGMSYVMLYPVIYMLSSGFKSIQDVYDPTVVWLPKSSSLQAMKLALEVMDYGNSLKRTLWMTLPTVLLQVVSSTLAGYGFARFRFRGNKLLFGLLVFTIIVPVQTYIIPLYVDLTHFDFFGIGRIVGLFSGNPLTVNLLNKDIVFYLTGLFGAGIRSGLYIFILRQFFINMPKELEEAAMIDGCGPFATFRRIMLPNTSSILATVAVFSVVWYWNDYYLSSMYYRSSFPLSVNLTNLSSLLSTSNMVTGISTQELAFLREPILACGCLITVLPLLLFYIVAQRFFTEGMERSGIVG